MIKKKLILGTQCIGRDIDFKIANNFLDFSFDNNIRELDAAERYPFPENNKNFGLTEKIIGYWIRKSKKRSKIKIYTKVTGRNFGEISKIQSCRLTPKRIIISAENSLKRLKSDYIDVYYLHWPDRFTNNFGRKYYNPDKDIKFNSIEDQLEAMYKLKKSGKILNYGLSNETAWGIMKFYNYGLKNRFFPNLQEEYSIINRNAERSIKEIVLREKLKFYAYSPLSGGLLTGKYHSKNYKGGRLNIYKNKSQRLSTDARFRRTKKLINFCNSNSLNLINLSLSFLAQQKFVNGIIIGSSSKKQLLDILNIIKKPVSNKLVKKSLEIIY